MLSLPFSAASFEVRGFSCQDAIIRRRLEQIGETFLSGYNSAVFGLGADELGEHLNSIPRELRGFGFEGAAMGLEMLDALTPWRTQRLQDFLAGPANKHIYMIHVGAGWLMARAPWLLKRRFKQLDPLPRWLVLDGYGFHEGYFHAPKTVMEQRVPSRLTGYERRAFDQGLGRALWFISGADPSRAVPSIQRFEAPRRADLWSGIGLAATYAGGADRNSLEHLHRLADGYTHHLAQGAAFAAKTRERAGNPAVHTELACRTFCNLSADATASITDKTLDGLPADASVPAYEVWRRRISDHFV